MQIIPVASVECLTKYILSNLSVIQEGRKQTLATGTGITGE